MSFPTPCICSKTICLLHKNYHLPHFLLSIIAKFCSFYDRQNIRFCSVPMLGMKWSFTLKHFKFPLFPLLTHSALHNSKSTTFFWRWSKIVPLYTLEVAQMFFQHVACICIFYTHINTKIRTWMGPRPQWNGNYTGNTRIERIVNFCFVNCIKAVFWLKGNDEYFLWKEAISSDYSLRPTIGSYIGPSFYNRILCFD